jgi:thioredoxin-like negative regulator of GroEL
LAVAAILLVSRPPEGAACVNEHVPNERGPSRARSIAESLQQHNLIQPWPERHDSLREQLKTTNDYRIRNDLAVALLHTGDTKEAVDLLEQIEAEHPGDYRTASTSG